MSVADLVDCSANTFNVLRCSACFRPSSTWITFSRFLTICEVFVLHFYLHCTHRIAPENFLNHLNSFHRGVFKLNSKFDAESLLYSLSHFDCSGHTAHMLTQGRLLPPLSSTVKSSFMFAHSSPLSLAARLHRCRVNCSHYINNSWTSSGQTSYIVL